MYGLCVCSQPEQDLHVLPEAKYVALADKADTMTAVNTGSLFSLLCQPIFRKLHFIVSHQFSQSATIHFNALGHGRYYTD